MIDQTIPEARRVATKLGVAGLEAARAICGTATRDLLARMPKELKDGSALQSTLLMSASSAAHRPTC
jgi:hypothetical protein